LISILALKIIGWQKEGELPAEPKYVMIAAPHTSNVDLPMTLFFAFAYRAKVYWMGKETIFKKPFGAIMKWLGGIPTVREKSSNIVQQSIEQFEENERLVMVVAPEGTRTKVNYWKSGFYYIALGAQVPIALGFLDYKRKRGGIGGLFHPTGNITDDMNEIQKFYQTVTARRPEKTANGVADFKDYAKN
jgi:1-acyl-sn-glycerol-3-phosphate acyltransferase